MTLPSKKPGLHIAHDRIMLPVPMNCTVNVHDGKFEYNHAALYNYLTPYNIFFTINPNQSNKGDDPQCQRNNPSNPPSSK